MDMTPQQIIANHRTQSKKNWEKIERRLLVAVIATIIRFQHQRCVVRAEQPVQRLEHLRGRGISLQEPQQLHLTGRVTLNRGEQFEGHRHGCRLTNESSNQLLDRMR